MRVSITKGGPVQAEGEKKRGTGRPEDRAEKSEMRRYMKSLGTQG